MNVDESCFGKHNAEPIWYGLARLAAVPTSGSGRVGWWAGRATPAHLDLYPLPASELTTNPNLTQNPGY